jgi:hypothetical protein
MEDKLKYLSNLNHKSSDSQKPKLCCGNTPEFILEAQKLIREKNLYPDIVESDKSIQSSQIIVKNVPNNPYCASITGKYAFDLSQISNFKVYFWKDTDDPTQPPTVNQAINTVITLLCNPELFISWNEYEKTQCLKSLNIFTTFTGTTSSVVNNYTDSDIVCVLVPFINLGGLCFGPYFIKNNITGFNVDGKVVFFINSNLLFENNLDEGTFMYYLMIHEWGHGFGFAHPHDNSSSDDAIISIGSPIMPGVLQTEPRNYQSIGGYIQNNIFNTVMTYNWDKYFLPENYSEYYLINIWGYPETIMPLDALGLRWMYNVEQVPAPYISTYGVQLINEGVNDIYHSRMIVGRNQTITFGSRCVDIAFYLSNQYITFNNLNYLRFEYIRNLQNLYSFYTKDIDAAISVLNLENVLASIFIENRSLTTNLTINLISASLDQKLFLYIMDSEAKYSITGNTIIRNKATGKTITINNPNSKPVKIYFNETTITRNINNRSIQAIENKKEVNPEKPKCRCGNTIEDELAIKQYIIEKGLDKQLSNNKSIFPSQVIIKPVPNNPYCSSITGTYAFDLTQISNFNIYFWKEDDNPDEPPTVNPAIKRELTSYSTFSRNWSPEQKTQCKKSLDIYTSFTGTSSTVIDNYENCDIVCVLLNSMNTDYGKCYGPYYIKTDSILVDNKIVYFINYSYLNTENIKEGGFMYEVFIHEWGHGFGLAHPHDNGFGSTIMPAIAFNQAFYYPAIAGYIQNTIFNTIMSYVDTNFFLPETNQLSTNLNGYPQTILPLDALALRWLYNITQIPAQYISTYGVNVINPTSDQQGQSAMIVGPNQTITFGSNNDAVNFYLTNQWFTYYNLQPIKYEYNRPIKKQWSFYPRELDSTISTINLNNTGKAFIFLENRALKITLTINIINNSEQVLNFYCMDCQQNYSIRGNVYRNRTTNKTFRINNPIGATVNVYFDA